MGWLDTLRLRAGDLLEVVAAAHIIALAVVNLTPTPRDDEFVARVYRSIEMLAGLITPLSKR